VLAALKTGISRKEREEIEQLLQHEDGGADKPTQGDARGGKR
jgi:hypothetical protein